MAASRCRPRPPACRGSGSCPAAWPRPGRATRPARPPRAVRGGASQRLLAARLEVGLDRPDGLLVEDALERRHVDGAVAHLAAPHAAGEIVVDVLHAGGLLA